MGCKEANRRAFVKSYERVMRGKVEENCESQWMKKFWESLGCVLIVCLIVYAGLMTCFNIPKSWHDK